MQLSYLALSLFFLSGFYYIGEKISDYFNLDFILNKISKPYFQYTSIGIAAVIFVLYPFFFLKYFNEFFFIIVSLFIVFLGLVNFYFNFSKFLNLFNFIYLKFKNKNFYDFLVIILIIFYFFLSISPVTSGDSVSYHMGAAKFIAKHGHFSKDLFYVEAALVGAGEFFNAFAISIKAYQLTSLINFIGIISIIGILMKFSDHNKLSNTHKNLLLLYVLSSPVLVFLTSSSKSQLFATSLIFISYALLIYIIQNNQKKIFLERLSFMIIILPIVAIQTKISFSISFFIIITTFFFIFYKKINLKNFILVFIFMFAVGLLPQTFWKQAVYEYPFYNFLINPYPINIPGYYEAYSDTKNYFQEKFPFILFMPLTLSDLTQFLGLGMFGLLFLLKPIYKYKKVILFIILFFLLVATNFGQKAARFYLEIYLFIILILSFVIKDIKLKRIFKIFNFGIILQSLFVICMLSYGIFNLLPGSFSEKYNKQVLSKYASGYNLYSWANKVLPDDAVALISHRSFYFAKKDILYIGMAGFFRDPLNIEEKKYYLKKIKEKEPNYIIFYSDSESFNYAGFDFKDCTRGLFIKKNNVGFYETRNPFNTNKNYYNGYIYKLDYTKLERCVKFY